MSSVRDQLISRVEVLSKVKALFLIPGIEMITTSMIADYFNVGHDTIRQLYHVHKSEIDQDGVRKISAKDFGREISSHPNVSCEIVTGRRGCVTYMINGRKFEANNSGNVLFFPRAVLRIGMLLRDSEVAKEVRTQLLNTFETASPAQRAQAIDEEGVLLLSVLRAEDEDQRILNLGRYREFMTRHIRQLEEQNESLNQELDVVYRDIETWSNLEIVKSSSQPPLIRRIGSLSGILLGQGETSVYGYSENSSVFV